MITLRFAPAAKELEAIAAITPQKQRIRGSKGEDRIGIFEHSMCQPWLRLLKLAGCGIREPRD